MDELDPEELMVISVVQYTQFILGMFVTRTGCSHALYHFFFPYICMDDVIDLAFLQSH